jgi:DNA-directed RNA polymerase alpha subunit
MTAKAKISAEAMVAISNAVKEGHSIFCLEQLGVPQRVINLLYDSGVHSVSDLVEKSPDQLLAIQNFGINHLKAVLGSLSKYHTIEDI